MLEQKVNTFLKHWLDRTLCHAQVIALSLVTLSLSACIPAGEQSVNTELFKDNADMRERTSAVKPGMAKNSVFEALGIKPERFEQMSTKEIQTSLYGNFQVQGTPEQLEKFKDRLLAYEGYALPYRAIKSDSSLGFGSMKVKKKGYDLKLVLIFEKGKLLKGAVEGTQDVRQEEDEALWGSLIRKGIGFAF